MIVRGAHVDARLLDLSIDDWEFIHSAVEAGWTTPRIMRELDNILPGIVFVIARHIRQDMRDRLKVCEHCRRAIATGRRAA